MAAIENEVVEGRKFAEGDNTAISDVETARKVEITKIEGVRDAEEGLIKS